VALLLAPNIPAERLGLISLAAALAWVRSLTRQGLALGVKWPNDLVAGERKVGGILPEARLDGARCLELRLGAGINVHQGRDGVPPPPREAASLDELAGRRLSRPELLADWLLQLEALMADIEADRSAPLLDAWRRAWPHRGRWARDEAGRRLRLLDVDAQGRLRVAGPTGEMLLAAGEISLHLAEPETPSEETGAW
jgi:BirA family biotin operon repressor/biotin-[acetyl-CoA-carboxylase] ligase